MIAQPPVRRLHIRLLAVDKPKLDALRESRRVFQGPDIDAAFATDAAPTPMTVGTGSGAPTRPRPELQFHACLIEQTYDVCGTFWRAS